MRAKYLLLFSCLAALMVVQLAQADQEAKRLRKQARQVTHPKGQPKIRRTIRMRESVPASSTAEPQYEQELEQVEAQRPLAPNHWNLSNSGPNNQLEINPNISVQAPQAIPAAAPVSAAAPEAPTRAQAKTPFEPELVRQSSEELSDRPQKRHQQVRAPAEEQSSQEAPGLRQNFSSQTRKEGPHLNNIVEGSKNDIKLNIGQPANKDNTKHCDHPSHGDQLVPADHEHHEEPHHHRASRGPADSAPSAPSVNFSLAGIGNGNWNGNGDGAPRGPAMGVPISGPGSPVVGVPVPRDQAMLEQPVMGQPVMGQPVMGPSVMGQPVMGPPVMGQPVMGQPVMGQPVMGQLVMGQPVMGRPLAIPGAIDPSFAAYNKLSQQNQAPIMLMRPSPMGGYLAQSYGPAGGAPAMGLPVMQMMPSGGLQMVNPNGLMLAMGPIGPIAMMLPPGHPEAATQWMLKPPMGSRKRKHHKEHRHHNDDEYNELMDEEEDEDEYEQPQMKRPKSTKLKHNKHRNRHNHESEPKRMEEPKERPTVPGGILPASSSEPIKVKRPFSLHDLDRWAQLKPVASLMERSLIRKPTLMNEEEDDEEGEIEWKTVRIPQRRKKSSKSKRAYQAH